MMHVAPGVRERTVSSAIYVDFRRIMEALRLLLIASSNICAVLDSRAELRDESSSSPLLMSSLNFATISLSSSRVKKSMFGVAPKSLIFKDLTFCGNKSFQEALNVVPFRNYIDQDVIGFPLSFVLIVLIVSGRFCTVKFHFFGHVLLLVEVLLLSICERCS